METIRDCTRRTATKIALRMGLSCFECGWNECVCDVHHIVPTSKGGSDSMSNLTYICPNCHRKAHNNLLTAFRSFEEVVGDTWKQFYNVTPRTKSTRPFSGKVEFTDKMKAALEKGRAARSQKSRETATKKIALLRESNIDFTKHGWVDQASKILDIAPQSVRKYLRLHSPDMLENAKVRKVSLGH